MGYTGKKALVIKLAYIEAFNALEAELQRQREGALPPADALAPSQQAQLKALVDAKVGMLPKEHQRKGYGRRLVALVAERYRDRGGWLLVGTGDVPGILRFYERCGFERSHVVENFFVDNYDHPMYEEGHKLMDMVYLKMRL